MLVSACYIYQFLKRHTVVGHENDDGVVKQMTSLQLLHQMPDLQTHDTVSEAYAHTRAR